MEVACYVLGDNVIFTGASSFKSVWRFLSPFADKQMHIKMLSAKSSNTVEFYIY